MNITQIHMGKLIRQHLDKTDMSKTEFARRIASSPQNVFTIFKRRSLDTLLLCRISKALEFDFFSYYENASKIKQKDGIIVSAVELKDDIDDLRLRIINYQTELDELYKVREAMSDKYSRMKSKLQREISRKDSQIKQLTKKKG